MAPPRPRNKLAWSPAHWLRWLHNRVHKNYLWEMRCGYDQKIGMAAMGMLSSALPEKESVENLSGPQALCEMMRAMFRAYLACDLDGEDSSGRSSMGSVMNGVFDELPPEFFGLAVEWEWVQQELTFPPDMALAATMQRLAVNQ